MKSFEQNDQDQALKLFVVMTRAMESVTKRVEEDIKGYGLNPTEFGVLELLYSKGNQPIQKIGEKVLLASSSITYVVDKLEKKELLIRKPCPKDRRVTHATITEKGTQLMTEIFPKHKAAVQEIFGGLETNEKDLLIDKLKKLGFYAQEL
ncbi:MarR family transcriptional regulator [Alkalihalobacillus sp. MEB130]|uniref:MarR family winged helix-turn-helix transcriptional regulator n=1 Tax=Alkalihalobacillus sp. MEB130 TaxID=2976704 RepID=UPI0028DEA8E6|nr:MarR family transcriptional regulator [Alkalihalobacillus sp. MEB130]MDT8861077.1 MarR family transcriptional regulator [Alkalihalobacillus sp. MEB130]